MESHKINESTKICQEKIMLNNSASDIKILEPITWSQDNVAIPHITAMLYLQQSTMYRIYVNL